LEFAREIVYLFGLLTYLIFLVYLRGRRHVSRSQHLLFLLGHIAILILISEMFFPLVIQSADERRNTLFDARFLFNSPVPFANWRTWIEDIQINGRVQYSGGYRFQTQAAIQLSKSVRIATVGSIAIVVLTVTRLWVNQAVISPGKTIQRIVWLVLLAGGLLAAQHYWDNPRSAFDSGITILHLAGIPIGFLLYKTGAWAAQRIKGGKRHGATGHPDPKPV